MSVQSENSKTKDNMVVEESKKEDEMYASKIGNQREEKGKLYTVMIYWREEEEEDKPRRGRKRRQNQTPEGRWV